MDRPAPQYEHLAASWPDCSEIHPADERTIANEPDPVDLEMLIVHAAFMDRDPYELPPAARLWERTGDFRRFYHPHGVTRAHFGELRKYYKGRFPDLATARAGLEFRNHDPDDYQVVPAPDGQVVYVFFRLTGRTDADDRRTDERPCPR